MKKRLIMAMALLMAFALPFLAMGCGGGTGDTDGGAAPAGAGDSEPAATTPEDPGSTPEPAEAMEPDQNPESEAPAEGTEEMSAEAPAEAAVEAVVEALTAENIIGTKWNAGGMTFTFEKDGVLKVNDQIPGTWSLEGTTLTVGAMGEEYAATLEGNQIIYEGTPLELID